MITFGELKTLSDRFAWLLIEHGLQRSDRVAVFLQNCPQFVIAFHGIPKAGGVYTPISPMSKSFELSHQLSDSGARMILAQDRLVRHVRDVCGNVGLDVVFSTSLADMLPARPELPLHRDINSEKLSCPDTIDFVSALSGTTGIGTLPSLSLSDTAALNYTGGTTGMPKGCVHSHSNMLYAAASGRFHVREDFGSEVPMIFAPQFWIAGENTSLLSPMLDGNTVVLLTRWDADAILKAIPLYGVTQISLPVDLAIEVIDRVDFADHDLSSLRTIRVNSLMRKLTPELRQRWKTATGLAPYEAAYGMTETHTGNSFTAGMQDDDLDLNARPIFAGLPVPETRFKIADFDTGETLPLGSEGEICCLTPSATLGYWRNDEATAELIRDGWIHTGDLGMLNADGYLHYFGRKREMIKVRGMSVFPAEIEMVLSQHPAVRSVAVVPRPDATKGQVPVAFVIQTEVPIDGDLRAWCTERLSSFKVPEIRFVNSFPMTGTGKIKKAVLAELAAQDD
ncbi:AMP-binding protein [Microvirga zambiensis]|uniref:AMP-binding protein n=1 Tax=Microvirga zambiensis TaxID=1402137 RepID=UPI0031B578E0